MVMLQEFETEFEATDLADRSLCSNKQSLNIIPNSGNTFAVSPASRADGISLYSFPRASSNTKDRNHECK